MVGLRLCKLQLHAATSQATGFDDDIIASILVSVGFLPKRKRRITLVPNSHSPVSSVVPGAPV